MCVFFYFMSLFFQQAVVNYDEIKNFIRQQVIKVFDGKAMRLEIIILIGDY